MAVDISFLKKIEFEIGQSLDIFKKKRSTAKKACRMYKKTRNPVKVCYIIYSCQGWGTGVRCVLLAVAVLQHMLRRSGVKNS